MSSGLSDLYNNVTNTSKPLRNKAIASPYDPTADKYAELLKQHLLGQQIKVREDSMNVSIRKITNGYILSLSGDDYYCEDMITVGKTVTALMVKKFITETPAEAAKR
jgi:hypothetical protein